MKRSKALVGLIALFLCGCGLSRKEARVEEQEQSSHGVVFKEGTGLTVPTVTREMLGLKIVDVQEGKGTRRIELPLRVFKADGDSFLASGPVETNFVAHFQPGRGVSFDGKPGGEIVRVESGTARLTGLAEVVVRLPASQGLQVGAFLDGAVTASTSENVMLIPKQALLKTAEGFFAYVVNGDALFRTKIGIGGYEDAMVEVTEGLYTGDRVVLHPIMTLWLAELQAIRGGKACMDGH